MAHIKHPAPGSIAASVLGNKKLFNRTHGTISLWSLAEHLVLTADLFKSMCMCDQKSVRVCVFAQVPLQVCVYVCGVDRALASFGLPGSQTYYKIFRLVLGFFSVFSRHQRCFGAQCSSELLAAGGLGTGRRRLGRVETLKDSSHA